MTKSYLKKNETKTIEVYGVKVTIKKTGFKETRKAIDVSTTVVGNKPKIDTSLVGILKTIYAIESWELVDENEQPLEISIDTFDNVLDEDFVGELMNAINKFQGTGLDETGKN